MTGYVRKDTTNNIADGNVINAADLDAEFDGVKDAFQASTGHKHDGTTGEGAPITSLGPNQDVTISATLLAPKTTNTVDIGSSALKFKDLFLAGNGSVGGTLAVTGVATLTANPVLSGGTANGVAYLNGSKVVTSGTALTFDGTTLKNSSSSSGATPSGNANQLVAESSGNAGLTIASGASSLGNIFFADSGDSADGYIQYDQSGRSLRFGTATSEKARLDSTGNLGLGVTPSASPSGSFFVKRNICGATTTPFVLYANSTLNASETADVYINTGFASRYYQYNGAHFWATAPSGTAGNAITFTQAMTLDASGNLALGSTSILGSTNRASFTNATSAKGVLALSNTSSSGYSAVELYDNAGGQQGAIGWGNGSVAVTGAQNATYLYSSGAITFLSGGTSERARITSAGDLLVGGTLNTAAAGICCNTANGISIERSGAGYRQMYIAASVLYFYNGSNQANLSSAGAWTNASDARLKNNIKDIKYGLGTVLQTQPRSYNRVDVEGDFIGFVAQELKTQIPEVVFGSDAEGDQYTVDYGSLVAVAFKAIQEQQALITTLTQRITALEAK